MLVRLATYGEAMRSIILDINIGVVVHAFKPFLNVTNNYDCPKNRSFSAVIQLASMMGGK